MESKLLKIKLNKGSEVYVQELIKYMQSNIALPKNEMEQKGYFWDSVFFAIEDHEEFMYLVLKSKDFSNIVINDNEIVATEFRNIYDEFRKKCWSQSGYTEPTFIACFNTVFEFDIAKT